MATAISNPTLSPRQGVCQVLQISEAPRVYYLKSFLSHQECDELIGLSQPKMARSTTVDPETGADTIVDSRSSRTCFYQRRENLLVQRIEERIVSLLNHPLDHAEGLQILHYGIGQEYRPHFDFFDPNFKGSEKAISQGGQRLSTVIMYLSTPEKGGETILPDANMKFEAIKGDALLFYNLLPNGEVDRLTLHGSTPVEAGEKWAATKWLRERYY